MNDELELLEFEVVDLNVEGLKLGYVYTADEAAPLLRSLLELENRTLESLRAAVKNPKITQDDVNRYNEANDRNFRSYFQDFEGGKDLVVFKNVDRTNRVKEMIRVSPRGLVSKYVFQYRLHGYDSVPFGKDAQSEGDAFESFDLAAFSKGAQGVGQRFGEFDLEKEIGIDLANQIENTFKLGLNSMRGAVSEAVQDIV